MPESAVSSIYLHGSYLGISCRHWGWCAMAEDVKVFGRRPSPTFPHAPRPASENLQGTKPRERARIGRCLALSYGDLAEGGPQLRSGARWDERWEMALQLGGKAVFCSAAGV